MDIGNNHLQGSIPERLGATNLTLITGSGDSIRPPRLPCCTLHSGVCFSHWGMSPHDVYNQSSHACEACWDRCRRRASHCAHLYIIMCAGRCPHLWSHLLRDHALCNTRNPTLQASSWLLMPAGNQLCGAVPGSLSVYNCSYSNLTCSAVSGASSKSLDQCSGRLMSVGPTSRGPAGVILSWSELGCRQNVHLHNGTPRQRKILCRSAERALHPLVAYLAAFQYILLQGLQLHWHD